ncbi:uracil-DNA glycosylase [Cylindrobasidium torrendii FP15055 ss-10]|uniref:Uracil-DNA glycosylase n=1 Tax=Cylindrobasidium torrendii FP15055 ss-10 TaxID=1314674 RepID=A0A0D7B247_9AGAR|nr:uracil-DNA glycosylase [Cylindrobasidium torrendii FP15055 ss-10]
MPSSQPDDDGVFLEDVQVPFTRSKQTEDASSRSSSQATTSAPEKKKTTATKRQRSIADMFTSTPTSKKVKATAESSATSTPPKVTEALAFGTVKLNAIPFNLATFVDSLSDENRQLLDLESKTMGNSWLKLLQVEITKAYFLRLKTFLHKEMNGGVIVFPPAQDIYAWSRTPLGKVKVVIIGQDPYHGRNQAHGLSFSVPRGVNVPPSLVNIYAELKNEYDGAFTAPKHGNLSAWASEGVLLLNTCLTVRAHEPGSHADKGWEQFTDKVVDVIDRYGGANLPTTSGEKGFGNGVVFIAWGAWAAKRVAKLDQSKHLILKSAHPSPRSADRGFFGNNHFKLANAWLEKKYGDAGTVDWCSITKQEE